MAKDKVVYPEGYYKVRVISNTVSDNKKNPNEPYLVFRVEVLERQGKKSSKDAAIEFGGHRYVNLYTSSKTEEQTKEIMMAAGYVPGEHRAAQLVAGDPDHLDLSGFEFAAQCRHEEWNGEVRDKFSPATNWRVGNVNGWIDNIEKPTHRQLANMDAMFSVAVLTPNPIVTIGTAAATANPFN